jgi:tripartite-type tricarboxylate transporter receptor subunit TctC
MTKPQVILGLALFAVAPAYAQYPEKPLRILMPFAPSGPSDVAARVIATPLSNAFQQPVIVENRPGANGAVAAQLALTAAPSGYTLLWGLGSMIGIPLMSRSAPFKSLHDFQPVTKIGNFTFGLFVHPSTGSTLNEFIKYASSGAPIHYAQATASDYLLSTQFARSAKLTLTRVPYKGGSLAFPDLITNRIQMYITPAATALPLARDGRIRLLALVAPARNPALPDIPTFAENGIDGISAPAWQSILLPQATPPPIAATLLAALHRALQTTEVKAAYAKILLDIEPTTPGGLRDLITADTATWTRFVRENNIPPTD